MLRASLKQSARRLAGGATTSQRAAFSNTIRERPASALPARRRDMAIVGQTVTRRSYAVAAEDTNKGVVCFCPSSITTHLGEPRAISSIDC